MCSQSAIQEFNAQDLTIPDEMFQRFWQIGEACFEKEIWLTTREKFLEWLQNNKVLVFTNDAGELQGYLIYRDREGEQNLHIMTIMVAPQLQRTDQKIGTQLVRHLMLLAQRSKRKVTLNSRPLNEPFYRKLGFKTCFVNPTYYRAPEGCPRIPGIYMEHDCLSPAETEQKSPATAKPKPAPLAPEQKEYEIQRTLLSNLAHLTKNSTSIWYGGWAASFFRSQRKEQAFAAIEVELAMIGHETTKTRKLNSADVLQTIIYNALIIRGAVTQTTSGIALLKNLNTPQYAELRKLVSDQENLTYQDLENFVKPNKGLASYKSHSPYRYF